MGKEYHDFEDLSSKPTHEFHHEPNEETLKFGMHLTGRTAEQITDDYQNWINKKYNQ